MTLGLYFLMYVIVDIDAIVDIDLRGAFIQTYKIIYVINRRYMYSLMKRGKMAFCSLPPAGKKGRVICLTL